MLCIGRTSEEERAYWDREMQLVEAANRRDEARQQLMQVRFSAISSTVRTIYWVDVATLVVMLAATGLAVLILVKLGLAIAG